MITDICHGIGNSYAFKTVAVGKAASPILVTESGIAIFLRLPHLQNAPAPMLVTESGMLTAVRPLHSKKHCH